MNRLLEVGVGVLLVGVALYATGENLRYARHGIEVEGTIVRVVNRVEVSEQSVGYTKAPVVEFLPVGEREPRRFLSDIWTHALFAPRTGERVDVTYLAAEPENARIDSWEHWLLPLLFAAFGVASLLGYSHFYDRERGFGFHWDD